MPAAPHLSQLHFGVDKYATRSLYFYIPTEKAKSVEKHSVGGTVTIKSIHIFPHETAEAPQQLYSFLSPWLFSRTTAFLKLSQRFPPTLLSCIAEAVNHKRSLTSASVNDWVNWIITTALEWWSNCESCLGMSQTKIIIFKTTLLPREEKPNDSMKSPIDRV